jgi:biotin carboxyl carrier protein
MLWSLRRIVAFMVFCLLLAGIEPAMAGKAVVARGAGTIRLACPSKATAGEPFMVRLTSSWPLDRVHVLWLGRDIDVPVSEWNNHDVALAMLGSDVKTIKPGSYDLVLKADVNGQPRSFRRKMEIGARKSSVQSLSVDPRLVTPPPEELERIQRERQAIGEALSIYTPKRRWSAPLLQPVDGRVSSVYGVQRVFNGEPRSRHRGLDLAAPEGTNVHAAAAGEVVLVGNHYFAGNSVYVDHGLGVFTLYFHLSEILVKKGDQVKRGDVIGKVGATGRATGPHLHLSVCAPGGLVDPAPLLEKSTDDLLRN